mmetsp:Transcript_49594/g.91502  ORF Transcript_49594/g.91502 Transcript_49594/m.91502 type:complete len:195 (-) Transcript_49594:37-621(-)
MGAVTSICRRRKAKQEDTDTDRYKGLTPEETVHAAACLDDAATIERLGAEGVDLNTRRPQDGLFPLDSCSWSGSDTGALALLSAGADASQSIKAVVGAASWGHAELLQKLLDGGAQVDQEMGGNTALHWAIFMGHEDCALLLQAHGAVELEPEKTTMLMHARSKRMNNFLLKVAQAQPDLAQECTIPASSCTLL